MPVNCFAASAGPKAPMITGVLVCVPAPHTTCCCVRHAAAQLVHPQILAVHVKRLEVANLRHRRRSHVRVAFDVVAIARPREHGDRVVERDLHRRAGVDDLDEPLGRLLFLAAGASNSTIIVKKLFFCAKSWSSNSGGA